jgi:hypothetical protein
MREISRKTSQTVDELLTERGSVEIEASLGEEVGLLSEALVLSPRPHPVRVPCSAKWHQSARLGRRGRDQPVALWLFCGRQSGSLTGRH